MAPCVGFSSQLMKLWGVTARWSCSAVPIDGRVGGGRLLPLTQPAHPMQDGTQTGCGCSLWPFCTCVDQGHPAQK